MAVIALEGMRFYAYHGFYEEERIVGNYYTLDVYVKTGVFKAAMSDDLFATVNYETIYFLCQTEMRRPTKLLETLVQRMIDRLMEQFEGKVSGIKIRLTKLNPPLRGSVDRAFVEMTSGSFGGSSDDAGGFKFPL